MSETMTVACRVHSFGKPEGPDDEGYFEHRCQNEGCGLEVRTKSRDAPVRVRRVEA